MIVRHQGALLLAATLAIPATTLVVPSAAAPAAAAAAPAAAAARGTLSPQAGYRLARDLFSDRERTRRRAAGKLAEARDETFLPALVDALFFIPRQERDSLLALLRSLTGEDRGSRYLDWVEYVGSRTDLAPAPGYAEWKGALLGRIDPRYPELIKEGVPARIRLEEVVWGGVRVEGIPALDRPPHVPAASAEAGYLADDERVFGVSAGGEHRAYPRRIVSWHEMANDVLGGEAVTLSFCTLCDSAVVYSGRGPGGRTLTFGTSGLLYRSNKLMLDRTTGTFWSNLTGEAVIGPLAAPLDAEAARLETLPVTLTTWGEWRQRHPETTVLALEPGRARRWGFDYRVGAADRAREGVSFPVWRRSDALPAREEIYALRVDGVAKAYPLARLYQERVVNDAIGEVPVVLVADPESGAVRAYRREGRRFAGEEAGRLIEAGGRRWRMEEEALVAEPVARSAESAAGSAAEAAPAPLPRLPGHQAFWFGWFGFFPDTEIYAPGPL